MKLYLLAYIAWAACAAWAGDPKLETEEHKALYNLGVMVGQNLASYQLTPSDLKLVQLGMRHVVERHELKVDPNAYRAKTWELQKTRAAAQAKVEKIKSAAFLEKAAAEKGATKLPSGLIYSEVKAGTGPMPAATDTVKVHYEGRLIDGTVFDSSYKRGQPADFGLSGVIRCWTEGLQKVKAGGKAKLVCPSDIAYGDRGHPPAGIAGGAALIFDVELIEVVGKK